MDIRTMDNQALAVYIAENTKKEAVIAEVFRLLRMDCLERCTLDPAHLDGLIRTFENTPGCSLEQLTGIIAVIRSGQETVQKTENTLVQSVVSYIGEHAAEDISIEQIAGALNVSYYYMCHIFREKYGMSVNTFRNRKRLELAIKRLLSTRDRITDIASACGFNNVGYFTEVFTRMVGMSPTSFRTGCADMYLHPFYGYEDLVLASRFRPLRFLAEDVRVLPAAHMDVISVHRPDDTFGFLHETAIIEYHGVLFASWYNCPKYELNGYTPVCEKRSYDGGKTWTELRVVCDDPTGKILYCPPVYAIDNDRLYMFVNQMVAPDHIHSLDLYVLNPETDRFELLWSRPIPFKLNTNAVKLPNGKWMLPGRTGQLDGFPNTPAVLLSDDGKTDSAWRLVKIAKNGGLPDGTDLVHPEISVICAENVLYMFCRDDQRRVPLVYVSEDYGETWSGACSHDIPCVSSKIYAGTLSDGRHYLIANIDEWNRSRLAVYFSEPGQICFDRQMILFDRSLPEIPEPTTASHYPAAYEADGKLYIIATLNYDTNIRRGAVLYRIDLDKTL